VSTINEKLGLRRAGKRATRSDAYRDECTRKISGAATMIHRSSLDEHGYILCPWCGLYVQIEQTDKGKMVAQHTDYYPKRVCEGSNRKCSTAFGEVLIGERHEVGRRSVRALHGIPHALHE
jgi:hypothetical protein